MLLTSSSSPATMIVSSPLAPCKRRMRRLCTLRQPTATMTEKTASPNNIAMRFVAESVIRIYPMKLNDNWGRNDRSGWKDAQRGFAFPFWDASASAANVVSAFDPKRTLAVARRSVHC